jgi:nucleoside-diphosphate-sugar epimerase
MKKTILVTGGCGYKGSVLVPKLLEAGHRVTVLDTQWFGCHLPSHPALDFCVDDIRNVPGSVFARERMKEFDAIIHLAGIANDPCGELDSKLTWEVNVLATLHLAEAAVRAGVRQFIFASSASVYGLKGNAAVVETDSLEPVSDYNKTKMSAERVLLSYADRMAVQIVRPATVCGMSPRMRLDTMVNMLTVQALEKGRITAHCGEQGANLMRPNIHIEDVTDLYVWMLDRPYLTGCWNAGFENISAMDTAKMITEAVPAAVEITTVKDKRSYAVDSSKLLSVGFRPSHSVNRAIREIAAAHRSTRLKPGPSMVNLTWMRENGWVRA